MFTQFFCRRELGRRLIWWFVSWHRSNRCMMSQPKKQRVDLVLASGSSNSDKKADDFISNINKDRFETSQSVMEFKFNKKRVNVLSAETSVSDSAKGIMYWMSRDQRVQDNWALLYAQKLALKNKLPLHICFCLVPSFLDATIRHYDFLLKGLQEVEKQCGTLDISFHLLLGQAVDVLPNFVKQHKIGAVVVDFSPLRIPRKWVSELKTVLPKDVPLCQVDAHNIVPCWIASEKLEYAARTIRNKINSKLPEFLTHFPPVIKHPYTEPTQSKAIDWKAAADQLKVDLSVKPVTWAKPGTVEGFRVLESFCDQRIKLFEAKRNDPIVNALSNLSPWFHFGQISVQRAILCVKNVKGNSESVAAFCEEAIIRRELSDNFCFYNEKYDSVDGTNSWGKKTLNDHKGDKREYLYSREEWETSKTHDDLWNSAQIQLVKEGKMHGYLRMYWAKKILEWSTTPEEALATAIYLNDRYSLDGRDPNGYVGCMWSICGIHDQGWRERPVFGKIRYMNYAGCTRKFDIKAYISRHGGKVHLKQKKNDFFGK